MKSPKGTRDLLPEETALFNLIEKRALDHFAKYGFREIRTPIFEETALFARGIGEGTDIVNKEMYSFQDKGGRDITLRPELTAPVCRAVIQHNLVGRDDILRLLYMGPLFRYERPQAGRYRQFHQLGTEVFGSDDPLVDAETLEALIGYLEPFALPNLRLAINSVGDHSDRPRYLEYLRRELSHQTERLCAECRTRLHQNVLRILDCKVPECGAIVSGLQPIAEFWSKENREHFERVLAALDRLNVAYEIDYRLVRGLDYYTKTAFELLSGDLGAQSAVMGGGRYDNLVELLGGHPTPAFGWAMGIDRLATIIAKHRELTPSGPHVFFVFGNRDLLEHYLPLLQNLRRQELSVAYDLRTGSFKSQMKRANREGARFVAILGEDEHAHATVSLKDMTSSEQREISQTDLVSVLKEACHAGSS